MDLPTFVIAGSVTAAVISAVATSLFVFSRNGLFSLGLSPRPRSSSSQDADSEVEVKIPIVRQGADDYRILDSDKFAEEVRKTAQATSARFSRLPAPYEITAADALRIAAELQQAAIKAMQTYKSFQDASHQTEDKLSEAVLFLLQLQSERTLLSKPAITSGISKSVLSLPVKVHIEILPNGKFVLHAEDTESDNGDSVTSPSTP